MCDMMECWIHIFHCSCQQKIQKTEIKFRVIFRNSIAFVGPAYRFCAPLWSAVVLLLLEQASIL